MSGGTVTIGESQIKATISGQGLVAGTSDWDGRVSISETVERVTIAETAFRYDVLTGSIGAAYPKAVLCPITQVLSRILITETEFGFHPLNEHVTAAESS